MAAGLAMGEVVCARQFDRRLVRLAAAADREHPRVVDGHDLGDPCRETVERLRLELGRVDVLDRRGLSRHGRHDLGPAVPDRARDRTAGAVEERAPVGGLDRAAVGAHGDRSVGGAVEHVVRRLGHAISFARAPHPSARLDPMSQPAFDFGDEPYDDPSNPTYSVGELADAINAQLRRGFDDGVWVRGEIDGLRHSGPHTYFALVEDGDDGRAVLNVSLFAPMKRNLTPILKRSRLELANGMKVRIFGQLDYYAPTGKLGLKMAGIDPRFTLGELSQARDDVVRRLVAAGLFDANRGRHLSPIPLRVGVVTSVGSAAWHDFRDELDRSGYGFQLAVCDTRVQGEWAVAMVAGA